MKKITLIILIIPILGFSQKKEIKNDSIQLKYNLKINTLTMFKDYYDVKFEKLLSKKSTFQIGFGTGTVITDGKNASDDYSELFGTSNNSTEYKRTIKSYNINAFYRYFISQTKHAPQGPVVGIGVTYIDSADKFESIENNRAIKVLQESEYSIFNVGLTMGFQYILFDQLVINPFFGAGYAIGNNDNVFVKGSTVSYGIDVGFTF